MLENIWTTAESLETAYVPPAHKEKMPIKITTPNCPKCPSNEFELWISKEESVACAKCWGCNAQFLLFDSEDYWFDVVAKGYPRKSRCACKEWVFTLRVLYELRDDGNVKSIKLWTTCRACELDKQKLTIKIDYSETADLINNPLRFCANPEIKYKLYEVSMYARPEDMVEIANYLVTESLFPSSYLWKNGRSAKLSTDIGEICDQIIKERYSFIYFATNPVDLDQIEQLTAKQEEQFWKRNEIIRMCSATKMHLRGEMGQLYYIKFSTEYIQPDAKIATKSAEFLVRTNDLIVRLESLYLSSRGPFCFDNPGEHKCLFGDQFMNKR